MSELEQMKEAIRKWRMDLAFLHLADWLVGLDKRIAEIERAILGKN